MSDRAPYSRVYWSVMDDPKFDGIRESARHMGAWTLLLIVADMAWPAPAFPPPTVPKDSYRALVEAGLVDQLSGGRFRLHGLDAERGMRSESARTGAAKRWDSERSANGMQTHSERSAVPSSTPMPSLAKPSQAETRQAQQSAGAREDMDPAVAYWELTGRFPTEKTLAWIDDLSVRFGSDAVVRALANSHIENQSTQSLLGRTQDRLRAEARELDRQERAAEQASLAEKRAKPPAQDEWREEFRKSIQERYGDAA